MENLNYIAELANRILNNQTKYEIDKKIIKNIFEYTSNNYSINTIILRLTTIDSYYSTQMSKRYFGIEEIAKKIWEISPDNENKIKEKLIEYAHSLENNVIDELFNNNYGIKKNGSDSSKAISLISKYTYYQTDFKFPIYDSLAKKSYPLIMQKYFPKVEIESEKQLSHIQPFINAINRLNTCSKIENYDYLDNMLWLSGKILKGNFSLLYKDKEEYRLFAEVVNDNTPEENNEGKKIDFSNRILDYIITNKSDLTNIFGENKDLIEFIKFSLSLKDN